MFWTFKTLTDLFSDCKRVRKQNDGTTGYTPLILTPTTRKSLILKDDANIFVYSSKCFTSNLSNIPKIEWIASGQSQFLNDVHHNTLPKCLHAYKFENFSSWSFKLKYVEHLCSVLLTETLINNTSLENIWLFSFVERKFVWVLACHEINSTFLRTQLFMCTKLLA